MLGDEERATIGAIWRERAQSELNAASGFAIVLGELFELGAAPAVLELASEAVHDEVRHAEICRGLAERYLGAPVAPPIAKRVSVPTHPGADAALVRHLHVVGLACVNETLAAAFLEACLEETTEDAEVRALAKQHLADEVRHGRVGWAHLATLDAATREAIGAFVPRMVKANMVRWARRLRILPAEGIPGHGLPSRALALTRLDECVRGVILPGFRHLGVPLGLAPGAVAPRR